MCSHTRSSILPGGQPSAPALVDLGQQNGVSFTWTVNQAAGKPIFPIGNHLVLMRYRHFPRPYSP